MKAIRLISRLVFVLFCAHAVGAGGITFRLLGSEEGIRWNFPECILQDRFGYLWFGSAGGLYRYDGYEFKVYRRDATDPHSLSSDWIGALLEDAQGELWVSCRGNQIEGDHAGLFRYDRGP